MVDSVELIGEDRAAGRATISITEDVGLPIREDAELKIRPRIFLEGNSFLDLFPGSPSAEELDENGTIPVNQTAIAVQFDEILTSLQRDTRDDLRTLFEEYGLIALKGGGAKGFNKSIQYWKSAYRDTALASEALLGTEEGDFDRLLQGQAKTFAALARDPQALGDLVSNFNRTAAAFASQSSALSASIPALRDVVTIGRPALQSLNATLPDIDAFARDALPAARSSQDTIPAAFPFTRQARMLVSRSELRGLARELKPTIPALAKLNPQTIQLLQQGRSLSRCQNRVLLPFARNTDWTDAGPDGLQSGQQPYKILSRSLEGLAAESREHDANSPIFRVLGLGGPETVINFTENDSEPIFGATAFKVNGVQPNSPLQQNGQLDLPVHRPDVPCEDQVPPDLNAAAVSPFETSGASSASAAETLTPAERAGIAEVKRSAATSSTSVDPDLADKAQIAVQELLSELEAGDAESLDGLNGLFGQSKINQDDPLGDAEATP